MTSHEKWKGRGERGMKEEEKGERQQKTHPPAIQDMASKF